MIICIRRDDLIAYLLKPQDALCNHKSAITYLRLVQCILNPLLPEDHFSGLQLAVGDNQISSHRLEINIIGNNQISSHRLEIYIVM